MGLYIIYFVNKMHTQTDNDFIMLTSIVFVLKPE